MQHTLLYISLPLIPTTTTWNFQKLLRVLSHSVPGHLTSSRAWYKMVFCPHSGYPSCLSSTLLRQQTLFLQKEQRRWLWVNSSEPTENTCTQGPGAHFSTRVQGLYPVLGHRNCAWILAQVLKKRCVHIISAQRVWYSGTSAWEASVNAPLVTRFMEEMSYVFSFTFFHCCWFSPCIGGLLHFSFCHRRYKIFMSFFQQKNVSFVCYLSL